MDGMPTDLGDLGDSSSVLPTKGMSDDDFEDLLERLLNALRQAEDPAVRVVTFNRYGRRGDPQYGRDFVGKLADGRSAMWQAKAYEKFTAGDAKAAIKAAPTPLDINTIVLSCLASTAVREEIAKHPSWAVMDARDLHDQLQLVPLHRRREILDDTWGPARRRQFMASPGQDLVVTIDRFAEARLAPDALLNDCGEFVGREGALESLATALSNRDAISVIVVVGPAGRGKSRLVIEALRDAQDAAPTRPVVCVAPGHRLTPEVIGDLPARPCIVLLDDAHRDLSELPALLAYAAAEPGRQLVLVARPSGEAELRRTLAHLAPSRVHDLSVGQLSVKEAKRLVAALTDGMDLDYAWTSWLRQQAHEAPHVAVITVQLLRSAALDGSLKTSDLLRSSVMAKYADITHEPIDGVQPDVVRRVVALLSLLRRVQPEHASVEKICQFVGLSRPALLRLFDSLADRGVLTDPDSGAWVVVPEILGDASADVEAVAGGYDSGFAADVWTAFKDERFETLFPALAELGWRVKDRDDLDIVDAIWRDAHETLNKADPDVVLGALGKADALPVFDPQRALDLFTDLAARFLPSRDAGPVSSRDWFAPAGPEDVLTVLAPLLGQVGRHEPALLGPVLDLLWALRRSDARQPNQHPTHPARVLADGPGDPANGTATLLEIVGAVERWLTDEPRKGDVATPLFALHSVVAKEGSHTRQTSGKELQFQPYLLRGDVLRPVRDRVRDVLQQQGVSQDLRRAGEAIDLLGDMVRRPRGLFGATVSRDTVLSWADDDLATLQVLTHIAATTSSPTIRRSIRHEIEYTAESAADPRIRHAARVLAIQLDDREGDDLAELLLHEHSSDLSRRGEVPPVLQDVIDEVEGERASGDDTEEARSHRISRRIEQRDAHKAAITQRVVDELIGLSAEDLVTHLRDAALEVTAIRPGPLTSLWGIYQRIRSVYPHKAEPLLRALDSVEASPLDNQAAILIEAWAGRNEQSLVEWFTPLEARRPELRRALAVFLTAQDPEQLGAAWDEIHAAGVSDVVPTVRDAFLMTLHHQLVRAPAKTVDALLAADASPWLCERAIGNASQHDGMTWGRSLSEADGAAILRLIDRAGWDDWTAQHVAAGLASKHPVVVLQHLTGVSQLWRLGQGEAEHLTKAFAYQAPAVVDWLLATAATRTWEQHRDMASVVLGNRLAPEIVDAFAARVSTLEEEALGQAVRVLESVGAWPQRAPGLARALLKRARVLGCEGAVVEGIRAGTGLWMVTGVNGESAELNSAIADATAAAANEPDGQLAAILDEARVALTMMAERDRARHEEDEEEL